MPPDCQRDRNGFLGGFGGRSAGRTWPPGNRSFSKRIRQRCPRAASHVFCVGTLDLASVSPIVRSFSNSVRQRHPIVSANLRQKPPLIARRPHFDCAPLQLLLEDAHLVCPPSPPTVAQAIEVVVRFVDASPSKASGLSPAVTREGLLQVWPCQPTGTPPPSPAQPINAAPDQGQLNDTLEKLRALQRQAKSGTGAAPPAPVRRTALPMARCRTSFHRRRGDDAAITRHKTPSRA